MNRQQMLEKYGSEEGVAEEMRRRGALSSRNSAGTGGFNHMKRTDPDRLRVISKIAADRRWGNNRETDTVEEQDTATSDFFAKGKDQAN